MSMIYSRFRIRTNTAAEGVTDLQCGESVQDGALGEFAKRKFVGVVVHGRQMCLDEPTREK